MVTWGSPDHGGDSSLVQDQLTSVQQIQGSGQAFAAVKADGSVVAWGNSDHGGSCHQAAQVAQTLRVPKPTN